MHWSTATSMAHTILLARVAAAIPFKMVLDVTQDPRQPSLTSPVQPVPTPTPPTAPSPTRPPLAERIEVDSAVVRTLVFRYPVTVALPEPLM